MKKILYVFSLYGRSSRYATPERETERDFVMHMHGTAIKRAPPPPRATFIPNTDMPFRRGAKTANNNGQDSFYIVRRAASTGMCQQKFREIEF